MHKRQAMEYKLAIMVLFFIRAFGHDSIEGQSLGGNELTQKSEIVIGIYS